MSRAYLISRVVPAAICVCCSHAEAIRSARRVMETQDQLVHGPLKGCFKVYLKGPSEGFLLWGAAAPHTPHFISGGLPLPEMRRGVWGAADQLVHGQSGSFVFDLVYEVRSPVSAHPGRLQFWVALGRVLARADEGCFRVGPPCASAHL